MNKAAVNGHALSDTSIITALIVIAAIGSLSALGGNVSNLLKSRDHLNVMPYLTPARATSNISHTDNVDPTGTHAAAIQASLNLSDYPTDMERVVLTVGVNGATTQLSQQLKALGSTLLAKGDISPEESDRIGALANQGLRMADLEASLEQASQSSHSTDEFLNSTIRFDGKSYLVKDAGSLIGFGTANDPDGDLAANGNYMLNSDTAKPETMSFLNLYQSAINDPDLTNHPESKAIVQKLSAEISYLSDMGSDLVFSAFNNSNNLSTLRQKTVSSGTAFDSYSIYKRDPRGHFHG